MSDNVLVNIIGAIVGGAIALIGAFNSNGDIAGIGLIMVAISILF